MMLLAYLGLKQEDNVLLSLEANRFLDQMIQKVEAVYQRIVELMKTQASIKQSCEYQITIHTRIESDCTGRHLQYTELPKKIYRTFSQELDELMVQQKAMTKEKDDLVNQFANYDYQNQLTYRNKCKEEDLFKKIFKFRLNIVNINKSLNILDRNVEVLRFKLSKNRCCCTIL